MSFIRFFQRFQLLFLLFLCEATLANTLPVTVTADVGAGSLRQVVATANSGDTIVFDQLLDGLLITLTGLRINLTVNLVMIGNGPANTIIDGQQNDLVFDISVGKTVVLSGLQIKNGKNTVGSGGGIINHGFLHMTDCQVRGNRIFATTNAALGGGILNYGEISLRDCQVFLNTACSATNFAKGGGVYNLGKARFVNTSIMANLVLAKANNQLGEGGGLYADNDSVTIISCRFSGNLSEGNAGNGGGIFTGASASTRIINSTISGNKAASPTSSAGGGIYKAGGSLFMENCVLAINQTDSIGRDIFTSTAIIDGGFNLIGDTTEAANRFPNSVLKGSLSNPVDPEFVENVSDAFLPTTSGNLYPMENSPATNAGNPDTVGLMLPALDLGDRMRINGIIDIGAYESCPMIWVINASFNPLKGTFFAQDSIHLSGSLIMNGNALFLSAPIVVVDPETDSQFGAMLNVSQDGCQ